MVLVYVGLILTTVAALLVWPFSVTLMGLLFFWIGVFFLFSCAVLLLTVPFLAGSLWGQCAAKAGGSRKPLKQKQGQAVATDPGLWDPWLDGT